MLLRPEVRPGCPGSGVVTRRRASGTVSSSAPPVAEEGRNESGTCEEGS